LSETRKRKISTNTKNEDIKHIDDILKKKNKRDKENRRFKEEKKDE